jgi:NADP-dependent 3-hydroxy acid dehydrogenase YdfG
MIRQLLEDSLKNLKNTRNSENIKAHDNMLKAEDVADHIVFALMSPANFHTVNLEIRPLKPKG